MAYRRRQGLSTTSTFKEETHQDHPITPFDDSNSIPSAAFEDRSKGLATYDYKSTRSTNERGGFWGVVARKAKAILDDEVPQPLNAPSIGKSETISFSTSNQFSAIQVQHQYESFENRRRMENPTLRMGLDRFTSSLDQIGDTIGNALEVAIATATKAKILLRELKTIKAELAFAKERCRQLEEENKMLMEAYEKGDHPADDDMIRLQLETLLAEKARLAHENSVYARDNQFLMEIMEYHQLTMQDMVYFDDGIEVNLIQSVSRISSPSPSPKRSTSPIPNSAPPSSSNPPSPPRSTSA